MLRRQKIRIASGYPATERHETRTEYGTPYDAFASIYPQSDGMTAQMYGLHPDDIRLLILPRQYEIKALDGVWLPGDDLGMPPQWEVIGAPVYSRHTSVTLRRRVIFGG